MTLIKTAKLNKIDPTTYPTDVLERIVSGKTKTPAWHTLRPWNWTRAAFRTIVSQRA